MHDIYLYKYGGEKMNFVNFIKEKTKKLLKKWDNKQDIDLNIEIMASLKNSK